MVVANQHERRRVSKEEIVVEGPLGGRDKQQGEEDQIEEAIMGVQIDNQCLPLPFKLTLHTCTQDPHQLEQVAEILKQVTISKDLLEEQHTEVTSLFGEFAECFALSMSKVMPVPGAHHQINILRDHKFRT